MYHDKICYLHIAGRVREVVREARFDGINEDGAGSRVSSTGRDARGAGDSTGVVVDLDGYNQDSAGKHRNSTYIQRIRAAAQLRAIARAGHIAQRGGNGSAAIGDRGAAVCDAKGQGIDAKMEQFTYSIGQQTPCRQGGSLQ